AGSDVGQVTINVGGANGMVWFVSPGGGGSGKQTSTISLSSLQAINNGTGTNPAAGDTIFLFEGAHTGPITLLNNQKLIGQDATVSIDTLGGPVPRPGQAYPAINPTGTNVTITSGAAAVTLGLDNTLAGLSIGNSTTAILAPTGVAVGMVSVREVAINRNGQATHIDTHVAGTGERITLMFNHLATFTFSGGVNINSGTNPAFTAKLGGTVTATGSTNTLATTTGTALDVENVTIGASGLTFHSITAGTGASG